MTYKPVNRNEAIRDEVLADREARAIYEATKIQIDLVMKLKAARLERKMTQEEVADIMQTKKPNISRLESNEEFKSFPSLLTIVKFASAIGYEVKIGLVPIKNSKILKGVKKRK